MTAPITFQCRNCTGQIFAVDIMDDDTVVWAHYEDTNCDDPLPTKGSLCPKCQTGLTTGETHYCFRINRPMVPNDVNDPIEEQFFRLLIENEWFENLESSERERLLLEVAQQCITWVQNRENF